MNTPFSPGWAIAAASCALLLSACSESSTHTHAPPAGGGGALADPGQNPAVARRFGLVQLEQPLQEFDDGYAAAQFARHTTPKPYSELSAGLIPPVGGCSVTRSERSSGEDDGLLDDERDRQVIGAGETIVFSSPAGTWLTIERMAGFSEVEYLNDDALPATVPDELVVDIPGDDFPAFAQVRVPSVTAPDGVTVDDDLTAPGSAIRWNAGDQEEIFLHVSLLSVDADGVATTVDCLTQDDGAFSLPDNTREALDPDFAGEPTLTRLGIHALRQNDALLVVTHESAPG